MAHQMMVSPIKITPSPWCIVNSQRVSSNWLVYNAPITAPSRCIGCGQRPLLCKLVGGGRGGGGLWWQEGGRELWWQRLVLDPTLELLCCIREGHVQKPFYFPLFSRKNTVSGWWGWGLVPLMSSRWHKSTVRDVNSETSRYSTLCATLSKRSLLNKKATIEQCAKTHSTQPSLLNQEVSTNHGQGKLKPFYFDSCCNN